MKLSFMDLRSSSANRLISMMRRMVLGLIALPCSHPETEPSVAPIRRAKMLWVTPRRFLVAATKVADSD
jgi:hypothetical protein